MNTQDCLLVGNSVYVVGTENYRPNIYIYGLFLIGLFINSLVR